MLREENIPKLRIPKRAKLVFKCCVKKTYQNSAEWKQTLFLSFSTWSLRWDRFLDWGICLAWVQTGIFKMVQNPS